jgi:hypothetical protein
MSMRISFQDVKQTTTSQGQTAPGQVAYTPDGATWIYVKASAAVAAGNAVIPAAEVQVETVSSSANNLGQKIYITEASAGWTVGAYAGAYGVVDDGTGAGQIFKVQDNTTDTLILYPSYALTTSLSVADSDITLSFPNVVRKSLITDKAQQTTGIAQVAFASGEYGWVLKQGTGGVIAGEVLTADLSFVTGDDTAGQVLKGTTAKGAFDEQYLGYCRVANAAADQTTLVYVNVA